MEIRSPVNVTYDTSNGSYNIWTANIVKSYPNPNPDAEEPLLVRELHIMWWPTRLLAMHAFRNEVDSEWKHEGSRAWTARLKPNNAFGKAAISVELNQHVLDKS